MNSIALAGVWLLSLGSPEPTFPQSPEPPSDSAYADTIELPGTTETRGKGPLNASADSGALVMGMIATGGEPCTILAIVMKPHGDAII